MKSLRHHFLLLFAAFIFSMASVACGDSESFTIEGTIEGNPAMNIRFIYTSNGTLVRGLTATHDGKFEYKGVAPVPTVLEILDNDYRPLGRVYVSNGERLTCTLTRGNPNAIKVSGDGISERWAKFLNDNSEILSDRKQANELIEKYVAGNPEDILSTLLMLTSYDASRGALRADSIMSSIDPSVRPSNLVDGFNTLLQRLITHNESEQVAPIPYFNIKDSLVDFRPSARRLSVIALSDVESGRADSIVPALKRLHSRKNRSKLQVVEFSVDKDTIVWHKNVRTDSATWSQGWAPGSIATPGIDRLAVPSVPYFIVVDSTGVQTLRTSSVSRLESYVDSCLNTSK